MARISTVAQVMPLLEIIRTKSTSPNTVALCLQMAKRIGKTPVVVGNCVGFTANRAFFPYVSRARRLRTMGGRDFLICGRGPLCASLDRQLTPFLLLSALFDLSVP